MLCRAPNQVLLQLQLITKPALGTISRQQQVLCFSPISLLNYLSDTLASLAACASQRPTPWLVFRLVGKVLGEQGGLRDAELAGNARSNSVKTSAGMNLAAPHMLSHSST